MLDLKSSKFCSSFPLVVQVSFPAISSSSSFISKKQLSCIIILFLENIQSVSISNHSIPYRSSSSGLDWSWLPYVFLEICTIAIVNFQEFINWCSSFHSVGTTLCNETKRCGNFFKNLHLVSAFSRVHISNISNYWSLSCRLAKPLCLHTS